MIPERERATTVGREPVAGVCCLDLGDPQVGDHATPIGDAFQTSVVERDEHPVVRQVDVRLQVPVAERDRGPEGLQRVLRRVFRSAAMRERDRRAPAEEGVRAAHLRSAVRLRRRLAEPPPVPRRGVQVGPGGRWLRRAAHERRRPRREAREPLAHR